MSGERKSGHLQIGRVGEASTPVIRLGGVIHDFKGCDSGNTENHWCPDNNVLLLLAVDLCASR